MKSTALGLFSLFFSLGCALSLAAETPKPGKGDADFDKLALDFMGGYLAARPLTGVALGLHQYDGKIGDYSRLAIDAEIERLRRFQGQLQKLDASKLSKRADIDRRILLSAIASELLLYVDMAVFEKNPMAYARALDVSIYIKRDFKPLADRVHDILNIQDQAADVITAAPTNLAAALPKPFDDLPIPLDTDLPSSLQVDRDGASTAAAS